MLNGRASVQSDSEALGQETLGQETLEEIQQGEVWSPVSGVEKNPNVLVQAGSQVGVSLLERTWTVLNVSHQDTDITI